MRLNNRISFKEWQLLPTFDYTVTVLNRLKGADSALKQDVWYATVIDNCDFTQIVVRNVNGNVVSVGGTYRCLVPNQDNYMPYNKWKKSPDGNLTFSEGDYIIKGTLSEDEIPTPNTIQKIFQAHRPEAFQIKTFSDNTGTIELAEHYQLEGV